MSSRNLFVAMTSVLLMAACGPKYIKPVEGSQTAVALSFFKNVNAVAGHDENIVVSPYSATVALSMLAEGAEGQTRAEFEKALGGIIFKAEDLGSNDTVTVKSSNSVWVDDNFSLRNSYVSLLQKDFDAFITTQRFSDPATVQAINNWCLEHTEGKIGDVIDRLDPGMVMVLINALYFKAPWENAFDPSLTSNHVFNGQSGKSDVQMMHRKAEYDYAEYEGIQMIRLPYAGGRYSMYVVLPPAGTDVGKLIPKVDEAAYDYAMGMFKPAKVMFSMPKFRQEFSMLLNPVLMNMGIRTAFTSAADFSGIAEMGPLVLDQVKQKCYVEVEEKGTEAAAVTVVQMRLTSVRPDQEKVVRMTVDRPFVFMISDSRNGNVLFAGKIVNL